MTLCVIFHAKENVFKKVTKIFFSNRDAILFSYNIKLNIISLTKYIELNFPKYVMSKNNYIFFQLPQIHL